jgi:orotate phosphoribosyltransferase
VSDLDALESLLRTRSLLFGDFTLASGQHSTYYIDARRTTMSAQGQHLIGTLGLAAIRAAGWSPTCVGGLTMGADPVAYAIAHASHHAPPPVDAFSVRKAPKDHGARQLVEGNLPTGSRAVITEDVITSGASALRAAEAVRRQGATVLGVLAVVDREQGGIEALRAAGLRVVSLTTLSRLGVV